MNNLSNVFKTKAFIGFITAGDPNIDTTEKIIYEMIKAGTSLIEIGIPFSDPIAEGKTIFNADMRALASGTTTDKVFDMIAKVRKVYPDFPMVFMTYLNPVYAYGYDKFFKKAEELGMSGIIIPDCPFEEKEEVKTIASKYNQVVVSMVAPTSENRIATITKDAEGFIYLVSSMGVTGVRSEIKTDLPAIMKKIRETTNTPVAIGFGISNPEQAKNMAKISDGAIVGSAIVNIIAEHGEDSPKYVYEFCKNMVNGVKEA